MNLAIAHDVALWLQKELNTAVGDLVIRNWDEFQRTLIDSGGVIAINCSFKIATDPVAIKTRISFARRIVDERITLMPDKDQLKLNLAEQGDAAVA